MKKTLQLLSILTFGFSTVHAQDPGATVGNTGSVTFTYNGQTVTHTSVRAADGKIWLQQNLGATQVASSTTDVNSYGDLFQWGRWDDGHQLRTSVNQQVTTLSNNTPAGISGGNPNFLRNTVQPLWWGGSATTTPAGNPLITDTWAAGAPSATNGTDPCTALGAGWRMPTNAEWTALRTAESITNLATGFSSNLKLPYGGYRNGANGSIQQAGFANFYWSSTNKDAIYPYAVYNGGSVDYWQRAYAATCRCIKDVTPCLGIPNGGTSSSSLPYICPGTAFNLSLSASSAGSDITYQWQSRPASSGTFTNISGATSLTFNVTNQTASTDYRCVVTCTNSTQTAFSDTTTVDIVTLSVDLGNDTTICTGNTLTLDAANAGAGLTYTWNTNATTQTIDVNTAGQYWVELAAANGCIGSDTINVAVLSAPTAGSINAAAGANNNYGFTVNNAVGATSYLWNFGDNSATSTDVAPNHSYQPGTYTVTVTISNDCGEVTLTTTVVVEPLNIKKIDAQELGISLYPNPTAQDIFLEYTKAIKVNALEMTNILGQKVYRSNVAFDKININHLANGLYFVHIHTAEGQAVLKVNIQK